MVGASPKSRSGTRGDTPLRADCQETEEHAEDSRVEHCRQHVALPIEAQEERVAGEGHGGAEREEVPGKLAEGEAASQHQGDADSRQTHRAPGAARDALAEEGLRADRREERRDAAHEGGVRHRDAAERQDEEHRRGARADSRQDGGPAGEPDHLAHSPTVNHRETPPPIIAVAERAIEDDVPTRRLAHEADQESGEAPEKRRAEGEGEAAGAADRHHTHGSRV